MNSRRGITFGLTFIAGLYFILDFIVPPTLPLVSAQGVVVGMTPATFSARSGALPSIEYRVESGNKRHLQILLSQRDTLGKPKLSPTLLRLIGVGATVTVRTGPFSLTSISPEFRTSDGDRLSLDPGQRWIEASTNLPTAAPKAGDIVSIEQTDAKLVRLDPGVVILIENGKRVTRPLGNHTVILKLGRAGAGVETQLDELKVGDTIRMGPATTFADNRDTAAQFNLVITTMAFGIGLISLGSVHSRILYKRKPGWYMSLFFFAAVVIGVIAGNGKYDDLGTSTRAFSDFLVLRVLASVGSAIFSLLAFYMASAAYRAFRIKTKEAALMMGSALIVMLGQTPFGSYLTSWTGERFRAFWLPNVAAWILRVPNTAVFRALIFGVMLGAIATALRYWLGMERSLSSGE